QARILLGQLGTIGRRPVPEKREHARLQTGSGNVGAAVRASRRGVRICNVARNEALPDLRAGHISELAHPWPLSKALVISEHEHLVAADRTSGRSAKLVPVELWYRGRVRIVGEIKGIPAIQG